MGIAYNLCNINALQTIALLFVLHYKHIMDNINKRARELLPETSKILSDIVKIPSTSGKEKEVVDYLLNALKKSGCDKVWRDGLGSVIGKIGNGPNVIAIDSHIDVVDVGDKAQWNGDPFSGEIKNGKLLGRGTADQKAGMASSITAAKLMKEFSLVPESCTVLITGTVMEEDCDGLCWKYLIEKEKIKPSVCIITEPTSLNVYRGHRGRLETEVVVRGKSAHGSAPERGVNAIYKMSKLIKEIENMGLRGGEDFLGKGTVVISDIKSSGPSLCAVPDYCKIYLDRRLGLGETKESIVNELQDAASNAGVDIEINFPVYNGVAYTGNKYSMEKHFPPWVIDESHSAVRAMVDSVKESFNPNPKIDKWTFSTNATVICGEYGIPCVGLGPGNEEQAHSPNEWVETEDLWKAAAAYAQFPKKYLEAQ